MTGYRELPYKKGDNTPAQEARLIIDAMNNADPTPAKREIISAIDEADLEILLRHTRHAYRMTLSEWNRRNKPGWQPKKRLEDNWPKDDDPTYDYGDDAGVGFDEYRFIDPTTGKEYFGWDGWWREHWGRGRKNPGLFRGTSVAVPPLVAIYILCNEWWRRTLRLPFNPDFVRMHSADTDAKRMPYLNLAAQIFLLVAQDAGGKQYNCLRCAYVHNGYYRNLDTSIPSD